MKAVIKAVIKRPGEYPADMEIENTLDALQQAVGGYIEIASTGFQDTVLIFNEEGKNKDLQPNIALSDRAGNVYDIIVGTIIAVGVKDNYFADLTDYQQKFLKNWLDVRSV